MKKWDDSSRFVSGSHVTEEYIKMAELNERISYFLHFYREDHLAASLDIKSRLKCEWEDEDVSQFASLRFEDRKYSIYGKLDVWPCDIQCVLVYTSEAYNNTGEPGFLRALLWGGEQFEVRLSELDTCKTGEIKHIKITEHRLYQQLVEQLEPGIFFDNDPCEKDELIQNQIDFNPGLYGAEEDLYAKPAICLTSGPKYSAGYVTTAENSLNNGIFRFFSFCISKGYKKIAIPLVYSTGRNFPVKESVHVVARTVRKLLEKYPSSSIEQVVFLCESQAEIDVLQHILPHYFPRTAAEIKQAKPLFTNVDENGATITEVNSLPFLMSRLGEEDEQEKNSDSDSDEISFQNGDDEDDNRSVHSALSEPENDPILITPSFLADPLDDEFNYSPSIPPVKFIGEAASTIHGDNASHTAGPRSVMGGSSKFTSRTKKTYRNRSGPLNTVLNSVKEISAPTLAEVRSGVTLSKLENIQHQATLRAAEDAGVDPTSVVGAVVALADDTTVAVSRAIEDVRALAYYDQIIAKGFESIPDSDLDIIQVATFFRVARDTSLCHRLNVSSLVIFVPNLIPNNVSTR